MHIHTYTYPHIPLQFGIEGRRRQGPCTRRTQAHARYIQVFVQHSSLESVSGVQASYDGSSPLCDKTRDFVRMALQH